MSGKHTPGSWTVEDPMGEDLWVHRTDRASVKVDAIPQWWPYPDTDRFVADIRDLTPID